ncbi:hypothetical protein [Streptomyces torulosus]|uniref:hypothetical protein n=1 Tax=Streptomyces torulosus TaxID=68276 RepID=UPI0012FF01B9|nr:hypothetical protein [Streptomyces torulosus]
MSFSAATALVKIGDSAVWTDMLALDDHPGSRVREEAAWFVLARLQRPDAAGG